MSKLVRGGALGSFSFVQLTKPSALSSNHQAVAPIRCAFLFLFSTRASPFMMEDTMEVDVAMAPPVPQLQAAGSSRESHDLGMQSTPTFVLYITDLMLYC